MNKEEKAIEKLKNKVSEWNKYKNENVISNMELVQEIDNENIAIDIILKELDKKDKLYNKALTDLVKAEKIIDLMVKELAIPGISIERMNLYNNVSPDKPIWNLIKEYFYKKVEEENE